MSIKKNPFGVGLSGERVATCKSVCPCCGAEHAWLTSPGLTIVNPPCAPCEKHDMNTPEGELIALREHHSRLPAALAKAREISRQAKRAEAEWKDECEARGRQVAAALDSRDRYKEIVEAVEKDPRCHAGPTIAEVRAEQHRRDWEDYR